MRTLSIACVFFCMTLAVRADDKTKGLAFFEKKITPVLVKHCYLCHSAKSKNIRGGLLLDTREGIRKGGESGGAASVGAGVGFALGTALTSRGYGGENAAIFHPVS